MKVKNLFQAGIDQLPDQDLRTRVIASNIVFITILAIDIITLMLNARVYVTHGISSFRALIPIILFFIPISCIVLNHYRYYLAARLIFFLSWTIFITAYPVWREATVYGYFLHPVFGIVSSTMALLMFSYRREKFAYVFFLTFSMLITVFSFEFVSLFDADNVSATVLTYTTKFRLHIYPFFFTVFFNLVLIYMLAMNGKFFDKQQEQHQTIIDQNKQLSETRLVLELTNTELETRVRERTLELMEQNSRLTEYAFFHAHVLRAPVSRIRGLLNLLNLPIDPAEELQVREMLSQTMKELDDTIHVMNDKLQSSNISRPQGL